MSTRARFWRVVQTLVLGAGVAGFLLIAGAYGLLVFFAHDAQVPKLPAAKAPATAAEPSGGMRP